MTETAPTRPFHIPTDHAVLLSLIATPLMAAILRRLEPTPTTEKLHETAKHAIACASYLFHFAKMSPRPGAPIDHSPRDTAVPKPLFPKADPPPVGTEAPSAPQP